MAHLRVDVRLARPGWQETFTRAAGQARQLGAKLEVALHLPKEDPEPGTAGALDTCSDCIGRVLALRDGEPATSAESLRAARRLCGALQTHAPIGGGTDANFCELNREQALGKLGLAEAEFLSWPITPQVHAFDNLSLIETL